MTRAGHPVRQETPRRGVPLRRKEVAPVLSDEPGAEESRDLGATRQFPELREPADKEDGEHAETQGELVDAEAADVDARTKPVAFEAQHGLRLDCIR